MIGFFTFLLMCFGVFAYVCSVLHYKSFFNPLGLYAIIWGGIPFLYSLRLSSVLLALSSETYMVLFLSYFSFFLGCILLTKRFYKPQNSFLFFVSNSLKQKAMKMYFFMLIVSVIEMLIKTPPLFSLNPFSAYMQGVGVRFLHFSVTLIVIPYLILFLSKDIRRWVKVVLFFPPLFIPLIYMQRGLAISFLIAFSVMFMSKIAIKRQILFISLGVVLILQLVVLAGNFRQSFNSDASSIGSVAGMNDDIPEVVMWLYTYTTPSVQNLNQTINNPDVKFRYGFDVFEPLLSLLQLKMFGFYFFENNELTFDVISGFNVPTYLNWAYLNFGYLGFILVPFILGLLSQSFFNGASNGNLVMLLCLSIWLPNIIYSFHDFLFWNVGMLLYFILIIYLTYRIVWKFQFNLK